jgi:hypothetical protein
MFRGFPVGELSEMGETGERGAVGDLENMLEDCAPGRPGNGIPLATSKLLSVSNA